MYSLYYFLSTITPESTTETISPDIANANSTIVVPDGPDLFVVIQNILNATFGIIGVVAVIMVIIGGYYYMTSQGEPNRVQRGKNTILYGIIGLIICLSAFAIVNFILNSLNGT